MLSQIRNASGLIIGLFLLVSVALVATIFIEDRRQSPIPDPVDMAVGEVEGVEIQISQYDQAVRAQRNAYQQQTGREVPKFLAERIDESVWDSFVESILMEKKLDALGLRITDDMVYAELTENPPEELQARFRNEQGSFDETAYQQALTSAGAEFWLPVETYVRTNLLPRRLLESMAKATVRVTEDEIRRAFVEEREEARIRYVAIGPREIDEVEIGEEELRAHYDANPSDYEQRSQASLAFVRIEKGPSDEDIAKAKERIESVAEKLERGTDFGRLARIHSDDSGSAPEGGDLGWFSRGQMVPEFDDAVFAMEAGAISSPFQTEFGWHVVRLEEKRTNEEGVEEVHAAHILKAIKTSRATLERKYERMREIADAVEEGEELAVAAGEDLKVLTTPPFTKPADDAPAPRAAHVPTLGALEGATGFAFENEVGAISPVMENDESLFLLRVAERIEAHTRPFEKVRTRVESQLEREKKKEAALERGRALAERVAGGESLDAAAESFGLSVEEPEAPITRTSHIDGIGSRSEVAGAAFSLEEGRTSGAIVMEERGVTAVVEVLERTPADESLLVDERDEIAQRLRAEKERFALRSWMDAIRAEADIVDTRDQFYGAGDVVEEGAS
ncbi:MAG: hypothetical protein CME06_15500 [Gemmatimonadetes bacterium]|nr:hypothetical protein [Gemmatimonadota bacterium]